MEKSLRNEWSPLPENNFIKQQCLQQLEKKLAVQHFEGYPKQDERFWTPELTQDTFESFLYGNGPWWTGEPPKDVDLASLPLHPWFEEMITNQNIGVVAGKGFYWNYGPNMTADPVVLRYDLDEPHILLITRKDTGQLALPGGFVDEGEDPVAAAARETGEEGLIDLTGIAGVVTYQGPTADIRATAHAWPETTAVRYDLPVEASKTLPLGPYKGGDDADTALWVPISQIEDNLFGSHKVIVDLSLQELRDAPYI